MANDQYLGVATSLARRAGKIIKSSLQSGRERTWKEDHTPVTAVDKQINQLVIDTIHERFPEHSILSEEGSDTTRSQEFVWVCDPIDGTYPFMHGIPISTFVLALVEHGQPVLGVIYDPYRDRLYHAVKGQGAFCNGQPIHTSDATELAHTTLGTVVWKDNAGSLMPVLTKISQQGVALMNLTSIAYMDSLVANGDLVATIFPGVSPHDSAAAKIIVEEAGGVFTSLNGEVDRYDRPVHGHIAAANSKIHALLTKYLAG